MAITATQRTSGDLTTPGTSFTTTSTTPGSDRLLLLVLNVYATAAISTPSSVPTGNSVTWALERKLDYQTLPSVPEFETLFLYRALGTTSAGGITITSNETWQEVAYSFADFAGVNTSGSSGSGAIVSSYSNSTSGAGTSESVTLAATSASNASFAAIVNTGVGAITPTGAGSPTELADLSTAGIALETQWVTGTSITSMSGSWSGAAARGVLAVEMAAAGAGGTTSMLPRTRQARLRSLLAR